MNHSLLLGAEEAEIAKWAHAAARASSLEGEAALVGGGCRRRLDAGAGRARRARRASAGATESEFLAVERVYFPWVNALNTLLDSLVDLDEDPALQRHIERYGSPQAAAERVAAIATRARAGVSELADAQRHELILAAMGGYYLAQPAAWLGERSVIAAAVLDCARAVRTLDTPRAQAAPGHAGHRPAPSPPSAGRRDARQLSRSQGDSATGLLSGRGSCARPWS